MGELSYRKLPESEIEFALGTASGWERDGEAISRKFVFEAYKDGVVFAGAVAYLADQLDHHPEITIGYAKVSISVSTHSVSGLSPFDFELARRINTLVAP